MRHLCRVSRFFLPSTEGRVGEGIRRRLRRVSAFPLWARVLSAAPPLRVPFVFETVSYSGTVTQIGGVLCGRRRGQEVGRRMRCTWSKEVLEGDCGRPPVRRTLAHPLALRAGLFLPAPRHSADGPGVPAGGGLLPRLGY